MLIGYAEREAQGVLQVWMRVIFQLRVSSSPQCTQLNLLGLSARLHIDPPRGRPGPVKGTLDLRGVYPQHAQLFAGN